MASISYKAICPVCKEVYPSACVCKQSVWVVSQSTGKKDNELKLSGNIGKWHDEDSK